MDEGDRLCRGGPTPATQRKRIADTDRRRFILLSSVRCWPGARSRGSSTASHSDRTPDGVPIDTAPRTASDGRPVLVELTASAARGECEVSARRIPRRAQAVAPPKEACASSRNAESQKTAARSQQFKDPPEPCVPSRQGVRSRRGRQAPDGVRGERRRIDRGQPGRRWTIEIYRSCHGRNWAVPGAQRMDEAVMRHSHAIRGSRSSAMSCRRVRRTRHPASCRRGRRVRPATAGTLAPMPPEWPISGEARSDRNAILHGSIPVRECGQKSEASC